MRDGEGRSLATAALEGGRYIGLGMCELTWSTEVPNAEFYRFEMGRRGEIEYTHDELEDADWHVDLSLGSITD